MIHAIVIVSGLVSGVVFVIRFDIFRIPADDNDDCGRPFIDETVCRDKGEG